MEQQHVQRFARLFNKMSTKEDLEEMFAFAATVKFTMFSTKLDDGNIVSRPMALVKRINTVDFYMITSKESDKAVQLEKDGHASLSLFRSNDYSWASISGTATLVDDREKIHELHSFFLRPFFDDKGDGIHNGGKDDPRIVLIKFTSHFGRYQIQNNTLSQAYELAKSALTGGSAHFSPTKNITKEQIDAARTT
ncbi:hypothetical protein DSO57_1030817 [Entomophthora muscae]|uniref:Uncharacterized protein n=1 Tax=Entomophthora muscae TaxID=34485 RepID=A0ACC2TZW0_9FUNG|nr:hypothetical protein DSO57_1030817 [Entomophthora muscae]